MQPRSPTLTSTSRVSRAGRIQRRSGRRTGSSDGWRSNRRTTTPRSPSWGKAISRIPRCSTGHVSPTKPRVTTRRPRTSAPRRRSSILCPRSTTRLFVPRRRSWETGSRPEPSRGDVDVRDDHKRRNGDNGGRTEKTADEQEPERLGCRPQVGTVWARQDGSLEHDPHSACSRLPSCRAHAAALCAARAGLLRLVSIRSLSPFVNLRSLRDLRLAQPGRHCYKYPLPHTHVRLGG